MHFGKIRAGDSLLCCDCDHERKVDVAWIQAVCGKSFPERKPRELYDSDLSRFRCSNCRSKRLLKKSVPSERVSASREVPGFQLATAYVQQANAVEQQVLLQWATGLLAIREMNVTPFEKSKRAISLTIDSGAILPFLKFMGGEIKRIGWDECGLAARMALSAASAALVFSGHGAGIAALGSAIGVPLWVVFGAGGAFAGVIIEEINRSNKQ